MRQDMVADGIRVARARWAMSWYKGLGSEV